MTETTTEIYPRRAADGRGIIWACCESSIGPTCRHLTTPEQDRAADARRCACARHDDGSVTTMLCPVHADVDPCLTMARVTGGRRRGTIRRGACTACGHRS